MINIFSKDGFNDLLNRLQNMDNKSLLLLLAPIAINVIVYQVLPSIKTCKIHKPKKFAAIKIPPVLVEHKSQIDEYEILTTKFKDSVTNFVNTLVQNFSESELSFLYNNLYDLTINKHNIFCRHPIALRLDCAAAYYPYKNAIDLSYDEDGATIYHELFHMASTFFIKSDNMVFYGFGQSKKPHISIGDGINEGYTQLLAYRYFCNDKKINTYKVESEYAAKLEEIIGMDKMTKLYFHADLYGLISELKNYSSEDKIMKFIADVDTITFINSQFFITKFLRKPLIDSCMKSVSEFLAQCTAEKQHENSINTQNNDIQIR